MFKKLWEDFKLIMGNDGGFWVPLAMAAYGAYQGNQQQKQAAAMNKAAAAQTEFSPLTGSGPGQIQMSGADALSGAIKGGMAGLQFQQANPNWGSMAAKPMDRAGGTTQASRDYLSMNMPN